MQSDSNTLYYYSGTTLLSTENKNCSISLSIPSSYHKWIKLNIAMQRAVLQLYGNICFRGHRFFVSFVK